MKKKNPFEFKFKLTFTNLVGAIGLIYSVYQANAGCAAICAGLMIGRKMTENIKVNINK